ncbi:hypothetical protein MalM25_30110 [Planctomycetes bacterium MalM25]|nr:hypothetical protein MalM25_30110 [Planctomycetes bacterium MalM25]
MRSYLLSMLIPLALLGRDAVGATVDWNLLQVLNRGDTLVAWTSPTPIDDGLPSHDFDYEITSVGIYYGGSLTPDDETDRYAATNGLTGSGTVGAFPTTLWTQTLTEPITDTSFDLDFKIDGDGYGQATFTNIALGTVLTDFGMNEIDISNLEIAIDITVVGSEDLLGDYDNDQDVDADDYFFWDASYGSTTLLIADGNGDGVVNAADYTIWRDNLTPVAAVAVPEPAAGLLVLFAVGSLCRRR